MRVAIVSSVMPAALAALVTVLVLTSQSQGSSACQPPFTNFGGHCAHVDTSLTLSWCDAAARCLQIGGEILIDIEIARAVRSGMSGWTWFGATDLLEERYTSRTGWRLTNGSVLEASISDWNTGNVVGYSNKDDFIYLDSAGITDAEYGHLGGIACQPIKTPNSGFFYRTNFSKLGNISPNYCFTETSGVENITDCLILCVGRWQCRAALHNANQARCRMLDFTDATVETEIENDPDFVKFVKVY